MGHHCLFRDKRFLTDVAFVAPLVGVPALVRGHVIFLRKTLRAQRTLERPLVGVRSPVSDQILFHGKRLVAQVALERPYIGVRYPFVYGQMTGLSELPVALVALVRSYSVVHFHVHSVIVSVIEYLAAHGASKRFPQVLFVDLYLTFENAAVQNVFFDLYLDSRHFFWQHYTV